MSKKAWLILIALPLLIALIIYCFIGKSPYVFYLLGINNNNIEINNSVLLFARCYGTDILWAFSFTISIIFIYRNKDVKIFKLIFMILTFEILVECMQLTDVFKGTFDLLDILAEGICSIIVCLIFIKYRRICL